MSKLIQLTRGKVAIVDDEDFEELNKFRWYCDRKYAVREVSSKGVKERIYMHRLIANAPDDLEVDHINGDGIDNRKENLRLCTHRQNGRNRKVQKNNTVGFKGVSKHPQTGKYVAEVTADGIKHSLGCYLTPEEASEAYMNKALQLHGEFANFKDHDDTLNPIREALKDVRPERNNQARSNTGYFGISKIKDGNRFLASFKFKGNFIKVGSFLSLHEAVRAYNAKAIELFGDKAILNVIKEGEKDIVYENRFKQSFAIKGYKDIFHTKSRKRYFAKINGVYWSSFDTIEDAVISYNNKVKELFGDKAILNPIPNSNNN